MSTYSVENLAQRGARHAFALILQHVRDEEEPFVTYGSIARLLETRLDIPRVFPAHIGHVAGTMMDAIETVDEYAPPINALGTEPTGIPGVGFGYYYNRMWRHEGERTWKALDHDRKLAAISEIRSAVRRYKRWDAIYRDLYRTQPPRCPRTKRFSERDGKPPETTLRPGSQESAEHRRLKEWAVKNPRQLGLSQAMRGTPECGLLSGDRIDVLFTDGKHFIAVEVKSILSTDDDFRRGLYQCIKYRAVLEAQERPAPTPVRALLLTERALPGDLRIRARELGVIVRMHRVNRAFSISE